MGVDNQTAETLANETLHEIIRSGYLQPIAWNNTISHDNGKMVAMFISGLYSGLVEIYKNAKKQPS